MKKFLTLTVALIGMASSAYSTELKCINLDGSAIERAVLCSTDNHCVLSVKMVNSRSHNIILDTIVNYDRTTVNFAASSAKNLNVILTHRGAAILNARVTSSGVPVANCK
jgi:hypothetical protein